jgi:ABC-type sugar transport system permease subunit
MISPITFYLSILGFIGTFKTFNHVYVMRSDEARGTADTISVVVFDTFRTLNQYGEAAAQAMILLVVIIAITQFQRTFLEKQVFYG